MPWRLSIWKSAVRERRRTGPLWFAALAVSLISTDCNSRNSFVLPASAPLLSCPAEPSAVQMPDAVDALIDFGVQPVGATATLQVLLRPSGAALTLLRVQAEQSDSHFSFRVVTGSLIIDAGVLVPITWTPTAVGADTSTFFLDTDSLTAPSVTIRIQGRGVTSCAATSVPPALEFGFVEVGTSLTLTLPVKNTGCQELTLAAPPTVAFAPTPAQVGESNPFAVAPLGGETFPLTLSQPGEADFAATFLPTTLDEFKGSVTFTSASGPFIVALHGYGGGASWECSPLAVGGAMAGCQIQHVSFRCEDIGTDLSRTASLGPCTSDNPRFQPSVDDGGTIEVAFACGCDGGAGPGPATITCAPNVSIPLSISCQEDSPCVLQASPTDLLFGAVPRAPSSTAP